MFAKKRLIWVLLALFLLTDAILFLSALVAPSSTLNATLRPTAEYLEQNPAATPGFITYVSDGDNQLCAEVDQSFFARVGVTASQLSSYLSKNQQVRVDNYQLPLASAREWLTYTCINGKCFGGEINFCVDTTNLNAGLHLASITVSDFDGLEHTYFWAFRYDPNEPTSDPNILPTPFILPSDTPPLTPTP